MEMESYTSFYNAVDDHILYQIDRYFCGPAPGDSFVPRDFPRALHAYRATIQFLGQYDTQRRKNELQNIYDNRMFPGFTGIVYEFIVRVIDIDEQDPNGCTSLHIASLYNEVYIVRLLVWYGADVNILDNQDWTPLMTAIFRENNKIQEILLQAGADPFEEEDYVEMLKRQARQERQNEV